MGICGSKRGRVTSKKRVLDRDSVQRKGALGPPKTHGLLFPPGRELEAAGGQRAENQVLIQNAQLLHRSRKKGFERPKGCWVSETGAGGRPPLKTGSGQGGGGIQGQRASDRGYSASGIFFRGLCCTLITSGHAGEGKTEAE